MFQGSGSKVSNWAKLLKPLVEDGYQIFLIDANLSKDTRDAVSKAAKQGVKVRSTSYAGSTGHKNAAHFYAA